MRWDSNADLRRLVTERREGTLGRREFLARLGATAAGATAASLVGGVKPAGAQKKVTVTMWDTEPNPATRAAMKSIVDDFHKLHKDIEIRAEGSVLPYREYDRLTEVDQGAVVGLAAAVLDETEDRRVGPVARGVAAGLGDALRLDLLDVVAQLLDVGELCGHRDAAGLAQAGEPAHE